MIRRLAPRAIPFALAAALTLGMLGATSALARYQVRVSATAGERSAPVAEQVLRVTAAAPLDRLA